MSDDRETGFGPMATTQAMSLAQPILDTQRREAILAGSRQRMRLLVNGVAGPLSDRQRALAIDVLGDLDTLCTADATEIVADLAAHEVFCLDDMVQGVLAAYRFVAKRKQLTLTLTGLRYGGVDVRVHPDLMRRLFQGAVASAVDAAAYGAQVSVELSRAPDRVAVDVWAPGWHPQLPTILPPAGSGIAVSVLHTASGARMVVSCPAAP